MKKILTLIFLSVFCLNAINAEVTWKLENGTLTISGTGNMENYSYRTAPWSNQRYAIHHVIIEQGITSIGDYSFQDCVDLFSVIIPNSVITIGNGAFCSCKDLKYITIPNSVTNIGSRTFSGCYIRR